MSLEFDRSVDNFFERRAAFFQNENLDSDYKHRIVRLKAKQSESSKEKPLVVISGAGPAGLLRAIQSISHGNPTRVLEKRQKSDQGRENTVALTPRTIAILKYCGTYQYLLENKLIYPANKLGETNVRLKDLENAMKVVLKELNPEFEIEYNSTIVDVSEESGKIQLSTQTTDSSGKSTTMIPNVSILVNTEGAHSSTNQILGIERIELLSSIPVMAAICKDDRPSITNLDSFFSYVKLGLSQVALTTYYHTIFIFQYLFSSNFRKKITGAIILPTPGQAYIGCGFSDEINNKLRELKQQDDKQEYQSLAKYWINLAICAANMLAFLNFFSRKHHFYSACHKPIKNFDMVEIGADRAVENSRIFGKAVMLLAGDADATVDPTTGLGCNTAIQSSVDFLDFLWDYGKVSINNALCTYKTRNTERVNLNQAASTLMRTMYRPDTVPDSFTSEQLDDQLEVIKYL